MILRTLIALCALILLGGGAYYGTIYFEPQSFQAGSGGLGSLTNARSTSGRIEDWVDLIPEDAFDFLPDEIPDELWDDEEFNRKIELADQKIREDLIEAPVKLPGYMVPLEFNGELVTEFLLVPQSGQCVHVPPPPVNQTIVVRTPKPVIMRTLYQPIEVAGLLSVLRKDYEIAETGYIINARARDVTDFDMDQYFEEQLEQQLAPLPLPPDAELPEESQLVLPSAPSSLNSGATNSGAVNSDPSATDASLPNPWDDAAQQQNQHQYFNQ